MARKEIKPKLQNPLLIIGLLFMSIFFVWRYHQARILSFNTKEVAKFSSSGIKPIHIKAYPVGVDVEVKEAIINNGVWTIYPNVASHLVNSAGMGDIGNMIIYGHNKNEVLGPIRWANLGSKIEVRGSDGKDYTYEIVKIDTVDPDNLTYIQPTNTEVLTLYTCTGIFDSKRFVVVANRTK